jgi:chromosome transmission fidelity protein 4
VYNGLGVIKRHNSDQENSLDVEFDDFAVHHALHLSNSEEATIAALSKKVLTTVTVGEDVVGGKLMVNYFSSGDVNKEWSVVLEEEEEIRGVAVGDIWVAVVTSKNHLRIFSAGGLQREVVMVKGPLVTMVGEGDMLLVVTHSKHPLPGQQSLCYTLYSVNTALGPLNISPLPLPLAPESDLYWAGFSDTLHLL